MDDLIGQGYGAADLAVIGKDVLSDQAGDHRARPVNERSNAAT
jgi:ATP phosphoribosyltransferase